MTSQAGKSLYEQPGGYDALAAAVDDLLPRLQEPVMDDDPVLVEKDHKEGRLDRGPSFVHRRA
jgi:hypothetical protein